jgi:hypothetical protein
MLDLLDSIKQLAWHLKGWQAPVMSAKRSRRNQTARLIFGSSYVTILRTSALIDTAVRCYG